ncbi:hypothetical protein [Mesorhizobium waimense]|uniref:hypothetical protein n=1 Tax=Mesorhizobium waimense TaxID=1300307 RepID=UPI00142DED74|nr:hypothetical protein [Mesorhizobium waimense]
MRVTGASIVDTDKAAYLMGDPADKFKTIWMHSKQMKALKLADLIDYVPSSEQGGPLIPYYMGLRCVVDDDIAVAAGIYTALMFKDKAILWNELPVNTEGGHWSSTASRARAMAAAAPKWSTAGTSCRTCPAPASSTPPRPANSPPMPSWRWRRTGTAPRRASRT